MTIKEIKQTLSVASYQAAYQAMLRNLKVIREILSEHQNSITAMQKVIIQQGTHDNSALEEINQLAQAVMENERHIIRQEDMIGDLLYIMESYGRHIDAIDTNLIPIIMTYPSDIY